MLLLRLLRERPKVEELFKKYSEGSEFVTPEQLLSFFHKEQKETAVQVTDTQRFCRRFAKTVRLIRPCSDLTVPLLDCFLPQRIQAKE